MGSFVVSEIIAWITVFLLVAAVPLTLFYFRHLNKKNTESLLLKLRSKSRAPVSVDEKYKFDNNWTANNPNPDYTINPGAEKKLAKIVLKTIALNGESGMLIKQISDILELHEIEVNYSLQYLITNEFIESVNSQKGNIAYLTSRGSAYCTRKGYLAEVA